jgi:hypothetical protein
MMDIYKAIAKLREEMRRIDRAIAALEQNNASAAGAASPARRRSWNADARKAAAERMKKYWELRKQKVPVNGASGPYKVKPASTDKT